MNVKDTDIENPTDQAGPQTDDGDSHKASLVHDYHESFKNLIDSITVTNKTGATGSFASGIDKVCNLIDQRSNKGNKLMFIGNGGSASIASHMVVDFLKNYDMQIFSFNDPAIITCLGNDLGYEHIFEMPIKKFAKKGDVLFAISSSGKSKNILNAVNAARKNDCKIVALSGFEKDNPLNSMGDFNFHVPSSEYGPVEVIHQYICHCIFDLIIKLSGK